MIAVPGHARRSRSALVRAGAGGRPIVDQPGDRRGRGGHDWRPLERRRRSPACAIRSRVTCTHGRGRERCSRSGPRGRWTCRVNVSRSLAIALTTVAIPLGPTCIITPIRSLLTRGLAVVPRTAAKRSRVVVMTVARVGSSGCLQSSSRSRSSEAPRLPRLGVLSVPLVVARVVVARVEVHTVLPFAMDAKQLLAAALRLSAEERAALAGALIQSLDRESDPDAEAAWSEEIRARLERLDAGTAKTIPWSEARRRVHAAAGRGPRA